MASFIEVLQNRDKKWVRLNERSWKSSDYIHFNGERWLYFDSDSGEFSGYICDSDDQVANDWEIYEEPKPKLKLWVSTEPSGDYLIISSKEPASFSFDCRELTREELKEIFEGVM